MRVGLFVVLGLVGVVGTQGCGALLGAVGIGGESFKTVNAAYERKDLAHLEKVCKDKGVKDAYRDSACTKADKLRAEQADGAVAAAVASGDTKGVAAACANAKSKAAKDSCKAAQQRAAIARMSQHTDCDTLRAEYEAAEPHFRAFRSTGELEGAAMPKFARCGDWDYLFRHVIGFRGAPKALAELEKAGHPVADEVLKFVKGYKGAEIEHDWAIATFLAKGHADRCGAVAKSIKRLGSSTQYKFTKNYFLPTGCRAATGVMTTMLTSDDPEVRVLGCKALGRLGSPRQVKKVRIVANTDPSYRVVRRTKVYFVRDACRAAAGRIAMRD